MSFISIKFAASRVAFVVLLSALIHISAGMCAYAQQLPPATAQISPAQQGAVSITSARLADQQYRIGIGDLIDIRVFNKPQFSRDGVRVGANGMIRVPFVTSEILARCHTEAELAQEISKLYAEFLRSPQVDVFVREYNSQPVAVMGAVRMPSRLQLRGRVRLLDLLSYVGGVSEKAGRSVQIIHTIGQETCDGSKPGIETDAAGGLNNYSLTEAMAGKEQANPFVGPGDIVSIPEADQAFVVGNVNHAAIIMLREQITVTRAIAMAGGVMSETKKDKVRVIRQLPGTTVKTELIVDLNAIDKHTAQDVVLQAGDIVDVPTSESRRLFKTLVGAFVPSVGQLPLRVGIP